MKRPVSLFCLTAAIVAVTACGNRRPQAQTEENVAAVAEEAYVKTEYPIEVDVSRKYDKKKIVLQDVAEVTYIPLETRKDVLMDNRSEKMLSMSDNMIVNFNGEGDIFLMGRDGRLVSTFNRLGRGPNEYSHLSFLAVDFDREEIYVYSDVRDYKIFVYSFAGEHKRTMNVPVPVWMRNMKNYDKENLLVGTRLSPDAMVERTNDNYAGEAYKKPHTPYYLVSKQTGKFTPLPIKVSELREGMRTQVTPVDNHTSYYGISGYGAFPITGSEDDVILSDYACDTIYSFSKGKLSPFVVPKGREENEDVALVFRTTRWSVLFVGKLGEELRSRHTMEYLGIDHKTGEIFEPEFLNSDCTESISAGILSDNSKALPAETAVMAYSALQLVDLRDAGKLKGRLAEIAAGLKEEDNPVLMLVKFKK